ncbi:MAG: hypothetical protein A3G33_08575 [Omnitrophica bacterium RIFCSPLOWO2_12_FULL_44_17]|uniref:Response regulatory domain-containing protein n=1 Tax=Candidatus Danuiimicrobium aquiferis TaxID=1801832 RepID=A0A1G1KX95_9BACT|nr:MAG: hypothetical protein A3B72_03795 [Omnitrophica bacterium RIFCSPHIGHO2_02_FULL_45_28]OGW90292.1 MAG: hypothetical protein A3E74_01220 [Omnitrophica bacterium RIFCSPHIGHO2_12_FULL_44_12]OGW97219.1 MAG: hypothetical protein A3G33_08575 [Omnitrophica bacterium RIFCSPLOWO2_12_FULL_44_17]OGX02275.1 MAG: hypothetical protein A3J12_08365 [Omnitrophica bacterium RIFCSPLOWO2_02_FULL_44_11]
MNKILIADVPDLCEVLKNAMLEHLEQRTGKSVFEILTVSEPSKVIKMIESETPKWLFLALEFASAPSYGLELLAFIRAISPGTKVIAMTTDDQISTVEKAIQLGADECLVKPFAIGQLKQILGQIVFV